MRGYTEIAYAPGDAIVFGPETRGLPTELLQSLPAEHCLRIPMRANNRSLNLANAVAVVVYEAWRQVGFPGAATHCGLTDARTVRVTNPNSPMTPRDAVDVSE